ncbi:MAG: hypothetical protein V7724_06690 [Sediminicola sp.]
MSHITTGNPKPHTLFFVLLAICQCSCNDDASSTVSENLAPNDFSLIGVPDGATEVALLPTFEWNTAMDPESDTVTYDLILEGNTMPSTKVASNLTSTTYTLEMRLPISEEVRWKVIAKDNFENSTESKTNSFTTRNARINKVSSNDNESFPSRYRHSSVVYEDKLWVMGGNKGPIIVAEFENDIWNSTNGTNWSSVNIDASYPPRELFPSIVFKDKIWIFGGNIFDNSLAGSNDIWTSEDGVTWLENVKNAEFPPRFAHTATIFRGEIWIIAGHSNGFKNDVWKSVDGISWTNVTESAPFSVREFHTTVVFDDKIWIIGGLGNDFKGKNDIWNSIDGINWVQVTPNANFSARYEHSSIVYDNKIWVIGGVENNNVYKNDVWSSTDGINWVEITGEAPFSPRISSTSVVFNDKIYLIGGSEENINIVNGLQNDVWTID